ncbi:S8 family serine peptidase [Actinoplanes friuliensis]|uniref:Putative subtilase-family protease n=1 Tax=Actinoplanes friuliensis DSM 7358 TaxID=1246995 RepID=U5VRR1_9ACTN|nr:S8 family serine peptidase [Actinoplanes friuliensis]AGZ39638.1 putative subtilase-family protease [Actinoplanes friuliensis DSM 7358]
MRGHLARRTGVAALAAIGAVTLATPLAAVAGPRDGASVDTIATVLDAGGRPTFVEVEAATVAEERRKADALGEAAVEVPVTALATPNDTYRSQQWGNTRLSSDDFTGVATGGQLVAVVDSGIRSSHPDFAAGQIRCDIGADFVGDGLSTNGCVDPNGHGTHVAGTVGAVANNGIGVAGIASGVPILPVRVLGAGGGGTSTGVANGIVYAVDHGATVITMSLGGGYSSSYDDAVKYATDHNVVVVAAAGNNRASGNAPSWPAASPGVESVAATDTNNVSASFSNSSGTADISAPGVNIMSTDTNGTYSYKSGTSMAAPHVAAAVALYRATHSGATEAATRAALESTAIDIESPGRDAATGAGLLNLTALMQSTSTNPVTPPASGAPANLVVTPAATSIALKWTAATKAGTTYRVYRNGVSLATSTAAAYVDKTITPATNYTYAVAAVSGGVTSQPSAAVPAYLAPTTPTKLVVTPSAATIQLRWTPSVKLATSSAPSNYVVYRDGVRFGTSTSPAFTDQAGTNHTYAVSAVNPAGESAKTDSTTAYVVPAAPTTLTTLQAGTTVKLTWRAPASPGGVSYTVYRDGSPLATVTTPAYADTTVSPTANATYAVSAVNPAGESVRSATALAYKVPSPPVGVTSTPAVGSIKLNWRAPAVTANASAATGYTVYRDGVQLATTTDPTYVDSSATANVSYRYTVAATNVAGTGPASAVSLRSWTYPTGKLAATTRQLAPGTPLSITGTYLKPGTTVTFTEAYKVTTTTMVNNKPVSRMSAGTLVLGSAVADDSGTLTFSALPAQDATTGTVTATAVDMNGRTIPFSLGLTVR